MELRIPEVGESVREALVARWLKQNGESVRRDEPLCEIETDKITLDLSAEVAGVLRILVTQGTTVAVGTVIAEIGEPAVSQDGAPHGSRAPAPSGQGERSAAGAPTSPHARREMRMAGIQPEEVAATGRGGRILPDDVIGHVRGRLQEYAATEEPAAPLLPEQGADPAAPVPDSAAAIEAPAPVPPVSPGRGEERRPMSPIRRRIAERLVAARQSTAMLTTFAEADLGRVRQLRESCRDQFLQRHGRALGLMPFFVRACVQALREYPGLNASIDGNDMVYHNYYDLGIAVGGERGLVVPVLRDADQLRLVEIDRAIAAFVESIRHNRLAIADLEGGTFTISNGGVYGSLLSTPLLNPPQSGVLGMHAIQERPVVRDGRIVIRPMMYLALSYDHRIVDGREAAGFLRRVRECVEQPEEPLLEG